MVKRCTNENSRDYRRYGARGITLDARWLKFENFFADMGERPTDRHTLERKDNSKGYSPENCVWATRKEQANNTRRNRTLTFGGKTQTIAQWAGQLGLPEKLISTRLRRGWSEQAALTLPAMRPGRGQVPTATR
jgi:hypothetical protein